MDLKRVLRDFQEKLNRILQSPQDDFGYNIALNHEYERVKNNDLEQKRDAGMLGINRSKNRYKDITPYDHSRVKLREIPGVSGSDYINASHVKKLYIAAQGPLPLTVNDFVRMLWEQETKVVIMACNEIEGGKAKCERYYPLNEKEPLQIGEFTISMVRSNLGQGPHFTHGLCEEAVLSEEKDGGDFITRQLKLHHGDETRMLMQLHYTAWPDHGIPRNVDPILDLIMDARSVQSFSEDKPPIVVHCSAGCGRTGTILLVDYVWKLVTANKLTKKFDLVDVLSEMRKDRQALVQNAEQFEVALKCVESLLQRELASRQNRHHSEEVYLNVDLPQHSTAEQTVDKRQISVQKPEIQPKPTKPSAQESRDYAMKDGNTTRIVMFGKAASTGNVYENTSFGAAKFVHQSAISSPTSDSVENRSNCLRPAAGMRAGIGHNVSESADEAQMSTASKSTKPHPPPTPTKSTLVRREFSERQSNSASNDSPYSYATVVDDGDNDMTRAQHVTNVEKQEIATYAAIDPSTKRKAIDTSKDQYGYSFADVVHDNMRSSAPVENNVYESVQSGIWNMPRPEAFKTGSEVDPTYDLAGEINPPPPVPAKTRQSYQEVSTNGDEEKPTNPFKAAGNVLKNNLFRKMVVMKPSERIPASPKADGASSSSDFLARSGPFIYRGNDVSFPNKLKRVLGQRAFPPNFKK